MSTSDLKECFEKLSSKYSEDDQFREQIISKSREIIKFSKQGIYSFHRGDLTSGEALLESAKKLILETFSLVESSDLRDVGSFRASLEEFVEGSAYGFFIKNNKIPTLEDLNLPFKIHYETYLLGLGDFSGELVRKAVSSATNNNISMVELINSALEELYGLFLEFNFRGGELRKKFDSLRHNLSKVNNIVYDLKLRGCYDDKKI